MKETTTLSFIEFRYLIRLKRFVVKKTIVVLVAIRVALPAPVLRSSLMHACAGNASSLRYR